MNITGSSDITVLQLQVTWDISGSSPVINIKNLSQGSNLAAMSWWFVVTSPSGTPIHQGTADAPDANGAWTNFNLTDPWPMPFNQIEFSGAPYNLTVYAKDSSGNIYTDDSYSATIVRPNGNTSLSKNFYGKAYTDVIVKCNEARIYFEDKSSTSYKGLDGTLVSSTLRVIYPLDPTYSVPPPFVASFTSPMLVPITYSSNNYQYLSQSIYSYQLSDFIFVKIQYQELQTFAVQCNIDLVPLVCEVTKLIDSIENGTCSDVNEAKRKLTLINPKLAIAFMGIMQPLIGVDVPKNIQDIIDIGGFDCDCCNASTGIIPKTASVIDGYSFSVVGSCGDITGSVSMVGSNIQFTLQDKSYIFNLSSSIPTTAFSITPSISGCVKTYTLNVNMIQFATDLANTILSNASLVNLWSTVLGSSSNIKLTVDGKCIFSSSAAYNYTFTLSGVPSSSTFALITGIKVSDTVKDLNFSLNLTNLAAFQAYLNGLGLGTFAVTNPSGQTVLITSLNNPNQLSNLTYSISSTNFIADISATASGYVPISANQVIQSIINYLCGITDAKIKTSQDYTITYVDANGNVQTIVVPAGTLLSDFLALLEQYNAQTIANIGSSGSVTCDKIKDAFGQNNGAIGGTDFIFATKAGGACSRVSFMEAFNFMLTAGLQNPDTKKMFCDFVSACGAGQPCAPYDFLEALVTTYDTTCAQIVGIEFTLS